MIDLALEDASDFCNPLLCCYWQTVVFQSLVNTNSLCHEKLYLSLTLLSVVTATEYTVYRIVTRIALLARASIPLLL